MWIIYQLECNLCKIQYVGKCGGPFNIRFNNHRKDAKDASAIKEDKHFTLPGDNFNTNVKFVLIGQLINRTNEPTDTFRKIKKQKILG